MAFNSFGLSQSLFNNMVIFSMILDILRFQNVTNDTYKIKIKDILSIINNTYKYFLKKNPDLNINNFIGISSSI